MDENIKLNEEEIAMVESEKQTTLNSDTIESLLEEGVIENVQNENE